MAPLSTADTAEATAKSTVWTYSAALFWGLQFAFLNPALALLLVALYHATPADVGWVLALYNASGFLAAVVVPALADRRKDYLRPLLLCAVLTLVLAGTLGVVGSLPAAVVALVVLGGPAGVGVTLLFAHLKHSGTAPSQVINTRAVVSIAWVAGPPAVTFVMGALGERAILPVLAVVAALNIVTTVAMLRQRNPSTVTTGTQDDGPAAPRRVVVALVCGFTALQATNSAAVSVMGLFVSERLHLPLIWAGIALGLSALLEIPALVVIGKLGRKYSARALIVSGCTAGAAYYTAMTFLADPVSLLAAQVFNAWFFGVVAGVGLTVFQDVIPRPGFAAGLYANTRRVGAIASGGLIAFGSATPLGYQGIFAACAFITVVALALTATETRTLPPAG